MGRQSGQARLSLVHDMDRCAWSWALGRRPFKIAWLLVWGALGMLHVLVPLAEWRRVAPFVLLGWGVGIGTKRCGRRRSRHHLAHLVRIDCSPDFTASLGKANQHGVFLLSEQFGHMENVVGMPDTAFRVAGPKWIRVKPRRFDLSDTFDFPTTLLLWGNMLANFSGRGNEESEAFDDTDRGSRWRTWVKQTFSTDESGLVLGMFAGDRKSVSSDVPCVVGAVSFAGGQWVPRLPGVFGVFPVMQRQQPCCVG